MFVDETIENQETREVLSGGLQDCKECARSLLVSGSWFQADGPWHGKERWLQDLIRRMSEEERNCLESV